MIPNDSVQLLSWMLLNGYYPDINLITPSTGTCINAQRHLSFLRIRVGEYSTDDVAQVFYGTPGPFSHKKIAADLNPTVQGDFTGYDFDIKGFNEFKENCKAGAMDSEAIESIPKNNSFDKGYVRTIDSSSSKSNPITYFQDSNLQNDINSMSQVIDDQIKNTIENYKGVVPKDLYQFLQNDQAEDSDVVHVDPPSFELQAVSTQVQQNSTYFPIFNLTSKNSHSPFGSSSSSAATKKNTCKKCGKTGHNSRTCPDSANPTQQKKKRSVKKKKVTMNFE